jgi:hypothetical protein
MKTLLLVLLATIVVALPACRSTKSDVPCTCGTPMGDLEGCVHSSCMNGKPNPDNPDCVCGTLDIDSGKKN